MVRAVLALALAVSLVAFYYSRKASGEPAAPDRPVATAVPSAAQAEQKKEEPKIPANEPIADTSKAKKEELKKKELPKGKPEPVQSAKNTVPEPPVAAPAAPQQQDPGPDLPARSYMGAPEGRFTWSGALPAGDRLVIVHNRVRMGTVAGSGLPSGVPVQVDARPADIRVVQQPSAANGFRLIVANQGAREVSGFTIQWRELPH